MTHEIVTSREFEDKIIAHLAKRAIVPADLRLRSLTTFSSQENESSLYNALLNAISGDELDDWAKYETLPPDAIVDYQNDIYALTKTELYVTTSHLFHTLINVTDSQNIDIYNRPVTRNITRRVWKQVVPKLMPTLTDRIASAELQPSRNARISHTLSSISLRGDALSKLYTDSNDEYLQLLSGTGNIGRLLIPATLFRLGDYPEYLTEMERLEDAAVEKFRIK